VNDADRAPGIAIRDPKLPGLPRAADGKAMGVALPAPLGLTAPIRVRAELLKHAPGKRAVFAYTLSSDGAQDLRVVGKLYRNGRGPRAFELLTALWRAARAGARGRLELPEPIAYLADLGMVVQRAVEGRPLVCLGEGDDWKAAIAKVAEALAALHDLEVPELPTRTLAEHVRRTCRPDPEALAEQYPELAPWVQAALEVLRPGEEPAGPPMGAAHGDLGVSQVFVAGRHAAFVDLDGACLAPPALDLARLIVSFRSSLPHRARRAEAELLERYSAARPRASLAGLERYQALAYLRRACARLRRGSGPADIEAARAMLAAARGLAKEAP
jgi:aminoglycoside phosphotransferase